jgi:hypothetical protein
MDRWNGGQGGQRRLEIRHGRCLSFVDQSYRGISECELTDSVESAVDLQLVEGIFARLRGVAKGRIDAAQPSSQQRTVQAF